MFKKSLLIAVSAFSLNTAIASSINEHEESAKNYIMANLKAGLKIEEIKDKIVRRSNTKDFAAYILANPDFGKALLAFENTGNSNGSLKGTHLLDSVKKSPYNDAVNSLVMSSVQESLKSKNIKQLESNLNISKNLKLSAQHLAVHNDATSKLAALNDSKNKSGKASALPLASNKPKEDAKDLEITSKASQNLQEDFLDDKTKLANLKKNIGDKKSKIKLINQEIKKFDSNAQLYSMRSDSIQTSYFNILAELCKKYYLEFSATEKCENDLKKSLSYPSDMIKDIRKQKDELEADIRAYDANKSNPKGRIKNDSQRNNVAKKVRQFDEYISVLDNAPEDLKNFNEQQSHLERSLNETRALQTKNEAELKWEKEVLTVAEKELKKLETEYNSLSDKTEVTSDNDDESIADEEGLNSGDEVKKLSDGEDESEAIEDEPDTSEQRVFSFGDNTRHFGVVDLGTMDDARSNSMMAPDRIERTVGSGEVSYPKLEGYSIESIDASSPFKMERTVGSGNNFGTSWDDGASFSTSTSKSTKKIGASSSSKKEATDKSDDDLDTNQGGFNFTISASEKDKESGNVLPVKKEVMRNIGEASSSNREEFPITTSAPKKDEKTHTSSSSRTKETGKSDEGSDAVTTSMKVAPATDERAASDSKNSKPDSLAKDPKEQKKD